MKLLHVFEIFENTFKYVCYNCNANFSANQLYFISIKLFREI